MKTTIALISVLLAMAIYSLWVKHERGCVECDLQRVEIQRLKRDKIELQMNVDIANRLLNDTNIVIIAEPPQVKEMIKFLHDFKNKTK